jgi:hypothetical protein
MKVQSHHCSTIGKAIMIGLGGAAVLCGGQVARAGGFSAGNLVVVRAGDGAAALSSAATAAFVEEYTTAGAPVGSPLALPTAVVGNNRRLTISGSATSEGFITLSTNGQYLLVVGYDAALGTASVASTASATVNRVVGRITISDGSIDSSTAVDMYNTGNIRSAASDDGTRFWTAGTSTTSGGVRYISSLGSTTSDMLASTPTNTRVVNIFNDGSQEQLYVSASSGTFLGVCTVGSGLPTTSGQTITLLNGFPTSGTHSSYDYLVVNPTTVYVADDGTVANGGGIQKWTYSGGTWSLAYNVITAGVRGLTGYVDGSGYAVLFATTTATSNNSLITVTDTGAGSAITTLASAGTNKVFRGVRYVPATCVSPSISVHPMSQTVHQHDSVSFSVSAAGTPSLNYQWFKGPNPLSDGGNVSGAQSSTLTLNPVALSDAGTYSVTVSNACGSAPSNPATLTVRCAADISPSSGNGQVNIDDLFAVIGAWGPCPQPCPPRCAADIAPPGGNCQVNIDDLFAVIGSWGICP